VGEDRNEREILAPEDAAGRRLDHFLGERLPEFSRAFLQKLIRGGQILVDGHAAKSGLSLRGGERIVVVIPEPEPLDLEAEDLPLHILYEDEHLAVVDKPAGLVVHPAAGHSRGTLVHALLHHLDRLSGIGGKLRPGIVHRLDKETSGLLLVAKSDPAHRILSERLAAREISREYRALVWGELPSAEGRIEGNIGRDRRHRQKMAVLDEGGKAAETRYWRLNRLGEFDYIRLALMTGRTHQIRVHLAWLGHPVLGDPLYGGRRKKLSGLARDGRDRAQGVLEIMRRQALHAARLSFRHPVGDGEMIFESPLPEDFQRALEFLGGSQTRIKESS